MRHLINTPILLFFVVLALLATAPFSNAQAQQPSEEQLAQALKRFPEADTDKDGKLTTEEIQQFRQSKLGNARPAAAAQPLVIPDHVTLEKDIVYLVAGDYEAYFPRVAIVICGHFLGSGCVRSFGQASFAEVGWVVMSHGMSHGFVQLFLWALTRR
jgi:hypothetical protein